jgi:predicted metalloprotease with PDZ domain
VWFDAHQRLDAELDLVLAHELVHRWIGGTLRLVGRGGREATWFSEGFTVHVARRALLQAGLLSPADFAADLNRTDGEGVAGEERLPAEYRRGALHAASLDAAVRRASRGRRSLDDVLRDLTKTARAGGKASLPVAALRDALVREIGAEGGASVDRIEAGDDAPALPDDAFGPCAHRRVREARGFELGFDRRSLAATPALIRSLVKGSAAERAGLREGALVLTSKVPTEADALRDGGTPREVELWLADGKRVRYRPVGIKRETVWEAAECRGTLAATTPGRSASEGRAP